MKLGQAFERTDVDDLVSGQIQRLQVGQVFEGRQIGDLVISQANFLQIFAFFQASQVSDFLAVGMQDIHVIQFFFIQLGLGFMKDIADGGFQVLVGERRRRGFSRHGRFLALPGFQDRLRLGGEFLGARLVQDR